MDLAITEENKEIVKNTFKNIDIEVVKNTFKDIGKEVFTEHLMMLRDYAKGALRYKNEKQSLVKKLEKEVKEVKSALKLAEEGDFTELKKLQIPSQYLDEKTVRLLRRDWTEE